MGFLVSIQLPIKGVFIRKIDEEFKEIREGFNPTPY